MNGFKFQNLSASQQQTTKSAVVDRTKIQFQGQTHSDEDWGSRRDRINKGPDRKKSGGLLAHKNSWPTTSPPAPGRKTGHGVYKLGEIVRNRCGRTCVEADELLAALATRCNRRGTAESTRSRADLADRWLTIRTGAAGWKENTAGGLKRCL